MKISIFPIWNWQDLQNQHSTTFKLGNKRQFGWSGYATENIKREWTECLISKHCNSMILLYSIIFRHDITPQIVKSSPHNQSFSLVQLRWLTKISFFECVSHINRFLQNFLGSTGDTAICRRNKIYAYIQMRTYWFARPRILPGTAWNALTSGVRNNETGGTDVVQHFKSIRWEPAHVWPGSWTWITWFINVLL